MSGVRDSVDEMVVVDTGSRDKTKALAASLGARVYEFPWVNDFARARNESIRHARGDWIFWLDADDRVDEVNRGKLKEIFSGLPENMLLAYAMKVECLASNGQSSTVVDHVRLFPRHSGIRWEYRVHENILPSINRLGGQVVWTAVVIQHVGYQDDGLREKKRLRDHALLLKCFEECPDDPFVHFNLGHSFLEGGDYSRAAHHLRESIQRSEPHYSQVKKAFALLAQAERARGDLEGALKVLEEGRKEHPKYPELLYSSGIYLYELRRFEEAERCFKEILETRSWPKEFGSFDAGILDEKSRHHLARVYLETGRTSEAEKLLLDLWNARPDYLQAIRDLLNYYLSSGKSREAKLHLKRLREKGHEGEALFFQGLIFNREGNLNQAAEIFKQVIELNPRHEEAIAEIAHIFLKLENLLKAEEYLRRHVQLNPGSPQARFNLGLVLWKRGYFKEALNEIERSIELRPGHEPSRALRSEILERLKINEFTR